MSSIRQWVKAGLRKFGFELRRHTVQTSSDAQLSRTLAHFKIDLVLDVGANVGQYASSLREHGYQGRIVSFEPSSSAYEKLARRAAGDPRWTVAPRMALGAVPGVATLNLAGNSESNSIRGMLPSHLEAAPTSAYFGAEDVPVQTLDVVAQPYLQDSKRPLLKVDTQGFEDAVLAGAHNCVSRIAIIQIELSLIALYENQILFDETNARLERLGFKLFALYPVYCDEKTGRTLQMDGLFLREALCGI